MSTPSSLSLTANALKSCVPNNTNERNSLRQCPACGSQNGAEQYRQAPDRFHGRGDAYQLARCATCSLVWLKDPPPPAEMGQHYGEDYDRAISGAGGDPRHWTGRRDILLRYKSGGAILDLGCSSGGFLSALKGPAWKLFGIEMSERVAREAEEKTSAQVFVGDILDAQFPPESFDAITCFHVFEHVYQPKGVLAKVYEWLKPGGIFYTEMPNIDSAGARIFRSYWYALELPRHLYHFSPGSLRNLAKAAGLQEVSITTHRYVFIEASVRYVIDDMCSKFGIHRTPMAQAKPACLPWKVVRKGFRLTILPGLSALAVLAGDGEIIHAIFAKK
ncbi:MAG TPA: class I SAM-dependent methyltransferase [Terriglobia bacterium]|nr:class I SAM-dependent methyltransferase [Terriglobia bacterium]